MDSKLLLVATLLVPGNLADLYEKCQTGTVHHVHDHP